MHRSAVKPKVLGFIIWLLSRQDTIKIKTPTGTNMEAFVQSEFPHVAPQKNKRRVLELGGGRGGLARFSACPHMTAPRPELADAASLCSCHRCASRADEAVSGRMTPS